MFSRRRSQIEVRGVRALLRAMRRRAVLTMVCTGVLVVGVGGAAAAWWAAPAREAVGGAAQVWAPVAAAAHRVDSLLQEGRLRGLWNAALICVR